MKFLIVPIVCGLLATPINAQKSRPKPPKQVRTEGWSFRVKRDSMTDKISILGHKTDNPNVTVIAERDCLVIDVRSRGGVSGLQIRFDDEQASPFRLATEKEQSLSLVIIDGPDFRKALLSKRLRVEILTVLNTSISEDISLVGLKEGLDKTLADLKKILDEVKKPNAS